ncbi:MAG: phosphoribosylformylglycinamidine synthase [Nitrospirae bacterium]|nr:phosphoribosylformylglycinamidine synthase [Nitrospirota bacterium]
MSLMHLYRRPALSPFKKDDLISFFKKRISPDIRDIETEYCFNIEISAHLTDEELDTLRWLLSETFEPENLSEISFLTQNSIIEVGPRMNFTTAWSTNAVSVCHACGLIKIKRIEKSRRYKLIFEDRAQGFKYSRDQVKKNQPPESLTPLNLDAFLNLIHDRMTEYPYPEPLKSFETGIIPEPFFIVPLIEEGKKAFRKINIEMGLSLDEWDIDYYYNLFVKELNRNPTNVECFDLGQSNSEHSRHWFFKGRLIIDGKEMPHTLMEIIKQPLITNPSNSLIAFKDNSSAIRGFEICTILPEKTDRPSCFRDARLLYHIIFTAETHNFPTGVAPFPGAETGTGGRIRDVHATGRGSLVIAGTAAYCVGNLRIPGYPLPWEDPSFEYPPNLATPLQIEIEASNGASDYGNKFGEPVIQGFTRSFGIRLPLGERIEWVKPVMFTGGIGQIDDRHIEKGEPEKGMFVIKIGGPAYRIGIGGGAASSMIHGENIEELDFSAVQRGDAEMEQKLNRVIRACVEMGDENPIISIHDQGAGGNSNVIKEIVYPAGARIDIRNIPVGDNTLSVLEIWGAEYQENDAILIDPDKISIFQDICKREKVPYSIIGEITGDGYIVVYDRIDRSTPVFLDLSKILGKMPQKSFNIQSVKPVLRPLRLPKDINVMRTLERVLRLISVGSKRFLTNKVDRSVTGLIAQQQCVGPLQLTLSNVAVVSQSHFGLTGAAISIGEQPIKGLISPGAMARISVGEAITNIMWAKISSLEDIKCSGNWMWAAKLTGEGAKLYEAAIALRDILIELGIAIDGGKDSLSMAAMVIDSSKKREVVKAPGMIVISAYATCPDITKVITPDIKRPGVSKILYIDLGGGRYRMGGSALAQVFGQIGDESPDVEEPALLKNTFKAVQHLIDKNLILSGHDRSDGGLIITLLEMAFAGNCGIEVNINSADCGLQNVEFSEFQIQNSEIPLLFSEELGVVLEYLAENEEEITSIFKSFSVPYQIIGRSLLEKRIKISLFTPNSKPRTILDEDMRVLRDLWEETSYHLDRHQANPVCVDEERNVNFDRKGPRYVLSFTPQKTPEYILKRGTKPKVAILREEGSNGDREMASAFYQAGFEVWDVTMTDLLEGRVNLDNFRGVAFVGGFSYADVLDSAKGWAGVIRFNKNIREQFQRFYERSDTFSLGVCNGCQLMALLGWIPWKGIPERFQPRFIKNLSSRFESRFVTVHILSSPSIMLRGMDGSTLGIWIAHGEGRAYFPEKEIMYEVLQRGLSPIRFVDDDGEFTEKYPFNPNGSPFGITALCSPDGRHLAMMPHPERSFLKWQLPYMPEDCKRHLDISPWFKMFQNAIEWCYCVEN